MRVLGLYAEDYPWDVRVEKIMLGFASMGYEPHLLCRNLRGRPRTEVAGGITCHRVLAPGTGGPLHGALSLPAPGNPVWRRRLDGLVRELAPDLLVVRDVPLATLAIGAGHRHGIPVIVDMAENHPAMWANVVANDPFPPRSWLLKNPALARRLERAAATRADAVFVVVEEMRDHLVRVGCPPERVAVVSNTPPLSILAAEADAAAGGTELDIVYVGNITASRGLQDVVEAVAGIGPAEAAVRFHIVGGGPYLDRLKARAAALGLGERAVFHGWVDSAQVPDLIARCNVGVIPHRRSEHTDTTIPNKIFDYMAVALPVLVSDAAPLRRIAEQEQCGVAYPSGDPGGLRAALAPLRDPEARRRLGRAGREAVRTRYHWERDLENAAAAVRRLGRRGR